MRYKLTYFDASESCKVEKEFDASSDTKAKNIVSSILEGKDYRDPFLEEVTEAEVIEQVHGKKFSLYNGDCIEVIKGIPSNSIHLGIHSPPFSNYYIYSNSFRDMGNCRDDEEFFEQYDYLIPELYRIMMPGRMCIVHCKQLVNYKGRDGEAGLRDFRGEIIRHYLKFGWIYHSEVCIWKDPVVEMQRSKPQGLLHSQVVRDSAKVRQGLPDYLIIFRKPGDNPEAIKYCFDEYIGEALEPDREKYTRADDSRNWYSIEVWQRYASPVWFDINQTNVLNVRIARDDADEKHICPLQLDVIGRAIELWSNPGDTVIDPFNGIGSVTYQATKMGRRSIGIELKESYFRQSADYCQEIEEEMNQRTLLDLLEAR